MCRSHIFSHALNSFALDVFIKRRHQLLQLSFSCACRPYQSNCDKVWKRPQTTSNYAVFIAFCEACWCHANEECDPFVNSEWNTPTRPHYALSLAVRNHRPHKFHTQKKKKKKPSKFEYSNEEAGRVRHHIKYSALILVFFVVPSSLICRMEGNGARVGGMQIQNIMFCINYTFRLRATENMFCVAFANSQLLWLCDTPSALPRSVDMTIKTASVIFELLNGIFCHILRFYVEPLAYATQSTNGYATYGEINSAIWHRRQEEKKILREIDHAVQFRRPSSDKKKYMRRKGKKWVRVPFEIINFVTLSLITLTVCCAVCILGFRLAWGHKSHHTKLYVCRRRAIIAHMVEIGGGLRLCTTAIHAALRHKHTTLWRHNTGCRAYQGSIT